MSYKKITFSTDRTRTGLGVVYYGTTVLGPYQGGLSCCIILHLLNRRFLGRLPRAYLTQAPHPTNYDIRVSRTFLPLRLIHQCPEVHWLNETRWLELLLSDDNENKGFIWYKVTSRHDLLKNITLGVHRSNFCSVLTLLGSWHPTTTGAGVVCALQLLLDKL